MSLLIDSARAAGLQGNERAFEEKVRRAASAGAGVVEIAAEEIGIDEARFVERLAAELGLDFVAQPLPDSAVAEQLREALPPALAVELRALPLRNGRSGIEVAVSDPFQRLELQRISQAIGSPVVFVLSPPAALARGLEDFYGVGADIFDDLLAARGGEGELGFGDTANRLDEGDEEASVLSFVNQIIRQALETRATDIHMEPLEDDLRVRTRIDGVLREVPVPAQIKALQSSVITRLKVMAKLDIAEKRRPQDGRIHLEATDGESIDVRVATIPTVEGESISLRLLGRERFSIDALELEPELLAQVGELLKEPNGIVLVTGPTGCGKSTTLYTFLSALNTEGRRIVTIEDPVEHKLRGVTQIAVKPEVDLTFAGALRSVLRGDPNIIMVGEMRDFETAEIAVRSALTGHLVFSTLHTNDSVGAITRLVDMGMEPFLVGSAMRAFLAQRLVRTLCQHCREHDPITTEELANLGLPDAGYGTIYRARNGGCDQCHGLGYWGRMAIFEICRVTPELRELVVSGANEPELHAQARRDGFRSLKEYGWAKVLSGRTSIEELVAATGGLR